jgi:hypothetical protein
MKKERLLSVLGILAIVGLFIFQLTLGKGRDLTKMKELEFNGVIVKKYFSKVHWIELYKRNNTIESISLYGTDIYDRINLGDSIIKIKWSNQCLVINNDSVFLIDFIKNN